MLRRWFPLAAATFGMVLLITGSVLGYLNADFQRPTAAGLPPRLAGLALEIWSDGQQVTDEISQVHASDLPLDPAAVGRFGGAGQVVLWVGRMATSIVASSMTEAMRTRINVVGPPVTQVAQPSRQNGTIAEIGRWANGITSSLPVPPSCGSAQSLPRPSGHSSTLKEMYP